MMVITCALFFFCFVFTLSVRKARWAGFWSERERRERERGEREGEGFTSTRLVADRANGSIDLQPYETIVTSY